MSRIIDIIRRVVQQELAHNRSSLLGVVTAIFPHENEDDQNNYEVSVRLKHENLELRKVPLAVGHIGVAAPPQEGDLVLVQFINGDINQPVVTGCFYHDQERPPLYHADEMLFEQRVPDGTLNQLRFTKDGTIYLQRDVTKPDDNSKAKASIKIDGGSGEIEIKRGEKIMVLLKDDNIEITCTTMTINGDLKIKKNDNTSTTISGNEITGA